MKDLIIGIILFCVSTIPTIVFTLIISLLTFVVYILKLKWRTGSRKFGKHLSKMALSVDQFANVSLSPVTNVIMVKRDELYHVYGDEDDTLSYVTAKNYKALTLSRFGLFWVWLLEVIDNDHMNKSIESKRKRDLEAVDRLMRNGYSFKEVAEK